MNDLKRPLSRGSVLALAATTAGIAVLVFFLTAHLGIFADDVGVYTRFQQAADIKDHLDLFLGYIPGRNLHIVWHHALFLLSDRCSDTYVCLHVVKTILLSFNGLLIGLILLRLGVRTALALVGVALISFWPTYGTVLVWTSLVPTLLLPLSFVLLLALQLIALDSRKPTRPQSFFIILMYSFATFTYDQAAAAAFAMLTFWIIARVLAARKSRSREKSTCATHVPWKLFVFLITVTASYITVTVLLRPDAQGPMTQALSPDRLFINGARILLQAGIPLKSLRENGASFLVHWAFLTIGVIVLVGAALIFKRKREGRQRFSPRTYLRTPNEKNVTVALGFLLAAIAAWLPAWAWYLSPRHYFIPITLTLVAFVILIDSSLTIWPGNTQRPVTFVVVGGLISLSIILGWETRQYLHDRADRTAYRVQVLTSLQVLLSERSTGKSACLEFVSSDTSYVIEPLIHENPNDSLRLFDPHLGLGRGCQFQVVTFEEALNCTAEASGSQDTERVLITFPGNGDTRRWDQPKVVNVCSGNGRQSFGKPA